MKILLSQPKCFQFTADCCYWKNVYLKMQLKKIGTYVKCNTNDITECYFLSRSLQLCYAFITEVPVNDSLMSMPGSTIGKLLKAFFRAFVQAL